jgi:chitodextrinase
VQRSTTGGTPWTTVTTTAADATTYTVTGLTHNTQYWFRIRANGASGNSANTASVTATP